MLLPSQGSHQPTGCRERFTDEEVSVKMWEFREYITDRAIPPAKMCIWFVEENETTHSHKQIRDKVRTIVEEAIKKDKKKTDSLPI